MTDRIIKNPLRTLFYLSLPLLLSLAFVAAAYANSTSNFQQTINPGTLSVDIVDGTSYASVANPSVAMGPVDFSFACQTANGTFGTASESIYVSNPDAADNGWSVALAATSPTDVWDSAGTDFDFNDGNGCTDGADTDSLGGQMTVDPSPGLLELGDCSTCDLVNVSKGSSASYEEGVTDSITIMNGASGSSDIGDWKLTGVSIDQSIPGEQPAASDYSIDMTLTISAN